MITRVEGGVTYTQNFDAENRLISVNVSGQSQPTLFIYDGDGNLVKQIKPDNSKTLYVGGIYEVEYDSGGSVAGTKTYYPAAGAMRVDTTVYYVLKDHLGSASVMTDASGAVVGENRYYPFGETRLTTGAMHTDKLFTGQRQITELGIYHYQARFYSPKLGRFLSADTIIPDPTNPQHLNRFSYVTNNPLRYTDPTGHRLDNGCRDHGCNATPLQKAIDAQKVKKLKRKVDERRCRNGNSAHCSGYQGVQLQVTVAVGTPTNLKNSKGDNVSPLIFYGISIVADKHGGIQLYGLKRDISFNPYFETGPAEDAHPMNYGGAGITIAGGVIRGTEFAAKGTNAYAGRSVDTGIGGGILAVDHYELFDEKAGKLDSAKVSGDDIGISFGFPASGGSFAVVAQELTPRIGLPIRDPYSQ
jgi:RHS repeat-associated protein